jgi:hypothetical protein
MRKSTMVELPQELEALNKDGKYDEIIAEAKAGEYHDFKNQKYACGKIEVVNKLSAFPELNHIRQAVMDGDYDEEMDEADKAQMREDFKDNPEMLKQIGL